MAYRCTCTALDHPCAACQAARPSHRTQAHRQVAPGTAGVRTREDVLADALREEAKQMQRCLVFARRHGITGEQAQRFLLRVRASLRRQRQHEAANEDAHEDTQLALLPAHRIRTAAQIGCPGCGRWWRITAIPMRTPCCEALLLVED